MGKTRQTARGQNQRDRRSENQVRWPKSFRSLSSAMFPTPVTQTFHYSSTPNVRFVGRHTSRDIYP